VQENVWGNFRGFTLNYEEKLFGGILIWWFLMFWSVFHVGLLRRGGTCVFFPSALGEFNWGYSPVCEWVDLFGQDMWEMGGVYSKNNLHWRGVYSKNNLHWRGVYSKNNLHWRGVEVRTPFTGEGFTLRTADSLLTRDPNNCSREGPGILVRDLTKALVNYSRKSS
jgi:hypothetical protein